MKHVIAIALTLSIGCGGAEDQGRAQAEAEAKKHEAAAPPPTEVKAPPTESKPKPPPEPEPTTPAEIDRARNQAMIDGRDKDVLKYCAAGKLDDKSNPQALLGCTLAACRLGDVDTAKGYSKALPKLLMDQAKRVCVANKKIGRAHV
jgi:hypothetical protein